MPIAQPTVIVADDDRAMRYLCRVNLELEGHRVLEAANAAEARRRLAEAGNAVLLLDSRLGPDDGIALGHELRDANPGLPIALLTGDTRADDPSARALTDHVIWKPFALNDLLETVQALASLALRNPRD
jgi:CheY-like chemotaxis protein